MRWDTLKQQELDLKLRIKVLKKQLVEPNRSHDQYEEIQTTLDVVLDEYQDLLMKKFKKSLSNWFNDNTILDIYNLLIEFDRNKHTSNFKEFVKNYNEYK